MRVGANSLIISAIFLLIGCTTPTPALVAMKPVAVKPMPPAVPGMNAAASVPRVTKQAFVPPTPVTNFVDFKVCFRYFKHPDYGDLGGVLIYDHIGYVYYSTDIRGPWTLMSTVSLPNYDYATFTFNDTNTDVQRFYNVSCSLP